MKIRFRNSATLVLKIIIGIGIISTVFLLIVFYQTRFYSPLDEAETTTIERVYTEIKTVNVKIREDESSPTQFAETDAGVEVVTIEDEVVGLESDSDESVSPQELVESHQPYVPLASIEPTEGELQLLLDTEELLIQDCMTERGFEYPAGNEDRNDLGSQSTDLEHSKEWINALLGDVSVDLNNPTVNQNAFETQDGVVVWDNESCLSIAQSQIYQDQSSKAESLLISTKLHTQINTMLAEDTEYKSAYEQWSICMSGYIDLTMTHAEQQVDVTTMASNCDQQTSFSLTREDAVKRVESIVLNNNAGAVLQLRQAIDSALTSALTISR